MVNNLEVSSLIGIIPEWLNGKGKEADIIISSRIRLARNLKNIPFTNHADNKKLEDVITLIKNVVDNSGFFNGLKFTKINNIIDIDKELLLERHLISPFFKKLDKPRAVLVGNNESLCIMINEEDHLRIQWIGSGLEIDKIWKRISIIDNELNSKLDFSFSKELGYLTACPTNTGTGMRVSFFCHIPGIILSKKMEKVFEEIIPAGIAVRGFYGEGSDVQGNIFQVSNQVTLGITEKDTIKRINNVAKRLIHYEKYYREKLLKNSRIEIEDKVYRALAIMKSAKIIPALEFMSLLSAVRLGVELEIIKKITRKVLNELMVTLQPAHIQKTAGKEIETLEKDILRAKILKNKIKL